MEHPDFGTICECECHRDNSRIFCSCFGECCEFEAQKFADPNGVIDVARFGALVMARRLAAQGKDGRKRR